MLRCNHNHKRLQNDKIRRTAHQGTPPTQDRERLQRSQGLGASGVGRQAEDVCKAPVQERNLGSGVRDMGHNLADTKPTTIQIVQELAADSNASVAFVDIDPDKYYVLDHRIDNQVVPDAVPSVSLDCQGNAVFQLSAGAFSGKVCLATIDTLPLPNEKISFYKFRFA